MTLSARRRRARDLRDALRDKTRAILANPSPIVRRAVDDYKKNAYREAILDAAEAVFVRVGYYEAKMADIAAQTGFSVGTLYNYFDNKEAVFAALVARSCGDFLKDIFDEGEASEPIARLHALVERGFAHVE